MRLSTRWCVFTALLLVGILSSRAQTNEPSTTSAPTNVSAPETASTNQPDARTSEPDAKPAPVSGKLDYASFKLVADRNIFNGNRSGQRMTSTRSSTQQRSVRVESFTLVGTLLSGNDANAFFDGTSTEFRQTLQTGKRIAGFTVQEILHAGVRLVEGTNTVELPVGTGMRREDEGLWKHSTTGGSYASSSGGGSSPSFNGGVTSRSRTDSNSSSRSFGRSVGRDNASRSNGGASENSGSSTSSSPPAAEVDAVLKRLMEQREKE